MLFRSNGHHGKPPFLHVRDGGWRRGRAGSCLPSSGGRLSARGRCIGDARGDFGQHQCLRADACGKGFRYDSRPAAIGGSFPGSGRSPSKLIVIPARDVQQAAAGTQAVSENISGVTGAAATTGKASSEVLASASGLAQQNEALRETVADFISAVRAA